jgi:hypothetical protein
VKGKERKKGRENWCLQKIKKLIEVSPQNLQSLRPKTKGTDTDKKKRKIKKKSKKKIKNVSFTKLTKSKFQS